MTPLIRKATLSDAEGVAYVHVESWKTTYKGLLPDDLIASRTLELRTRQWTNQLGTENPSRQLFVAEADGRIAAYAQFGITRVPDLPYTHELFAIYGLLGAQRQGIGTQLVRHGVEWLIGQGAQTMMLWVLKGNLAGRAFYEHLGGEVAAERIDPDFPLPVMELAYGWNDLKSLHLRLNS